MIATNLLHRGFTGAFGDFIFRNYNGKTVVSRRPVYKNETNTEKRRQARGRFSDATNFASIVLLDKKQKVYYTQKARQLKLPNAYTAAITDYLRKAKVTVITRSSFAAKKGDIIDIRMSKSVFKINSISVMVCDKDGKALSKQDLVKRDTQKKFTFKLTDNFPDYASMKIVSDEPLKNTYIINASECKVLPIDRFD